MSGLTVTSLTKRYKDTLALDDVSLTAQPGRLLGLVGANGAGKTTLFQCAAGMIEIDAGTVTVAGEPRGSIAARRALGYLPEEPVLWPELTVAEHLQFIARAFTVEGWRAKVDVLLERLDLTGSRNAMGGGLSQGMRRKVSLAMVLLHDSSVLLLDEPFNGLDPQAQHELRTYLHELRAAGTCIVLSSHRLAELASLADDFALLAHGRLVVSGGLPQLQAASGLPGEPDLEAVYLALAG